MDLMKLGRDEVLIAQRMRLGFSARSVQGWIQGRANIGHGVAPSPKDFFSRSEGYINKQNAKRGDLKA